MVPALGLAIVHLAVYDFYKESYLRGARPDQGGEGHDADAWRLSQLLQSDDQTAEIYRDENVWPMRLWALVSLAPHSYLMAICAMFNRLDVYLFIRVFVMNGIFLVAIIWQRHATRRTIERLAGVGAIKVTGTGQPVTT